MIVEGQKVKVKWHGTNRKHYQSLGYIYTKQGDEIEVSPYDLPESSRIEILICCDNCGKKEYKKRVGLNINGNQFCSGNCAGQYKFTNYNPNPKKDKIEVECEQCQIKFDVHESIVNKNKWHFCSRECYANFRSDEIIGDKVYNYQGIETKCKICDKKFKTDKWHLDNNKDKFCSQECYYEFRSRYYIGENHPQYGITKTPEQRERMRIVTATRIANGEFPQTNTSIQIKTKEIVDELNFKFEEEIQFKYYVLDFYDKTNNLAIEVMGDYWHGNPEKYLTYDELHDIQKKDVKRDKSKKTYLKKYHDIDVLYLWEYDINNNHELCKELIKLYVNNNGTLADYNSYNYTIEDGNILLNSEIIKPYFMKANTIYQTS